MNVTALWQHIHRATTPGLKGALLRALRRELQATGPHSLADLLIASGAVWTPPDEDDGARRTSPSGVASAALATTGGAGS